MADSVWAPKSSTATACRSNDPELAPRCSTCQRRLNGGFVTTPIRLGWAKNWTCATEPSGSVAAALTLINIPALNRSPGAGHNIDTCGARLSGPGCAWTTFSPPTVSRTPTQNDPGIANFFMGQD